MTRQDAVEMDSAAREILHALRCDMMESPDREQESFMDLLLSKPQPCTLLDLIDVLNELEGMYPTGENYDDVVMAAYAQKAVVESGMYGELGYTSEVEYVRSFIN